jgi:hypothetical protein
VLMGTSLSHDCAAAAGLGHTPQGMFEHALGGVFCDTVTKARLRDIGASHVWETSAS